MRISQLGDKFCPLNSLYAFNQFIWRTSRFRLEARFGADSLQPLVGVFHFSACLRGLILLPSDVATSIVMPTFASMGIIISPELMLPILWALRR